MALRPAPIHSRSPSLHAPNVPTLMLLKAIIDRERFRVSAALRRRTLGLEVRRAFDRLGEDRALADAAATRLNIGRDRYVMLTAVNERGDTVIDVYTVGGERIAAGVRPAPQFRAGARLRANVVWNRAVKARAWRRWEQRRLPAGRAI